MYVIVTDMLVDRMYLAWQPYLFGNGYFWTHKEMFDKCLYDEGWNAKEHMFAFPSHGQAMDVMLNLDIDKSWKAHVVEI